MVDPWSYAAKTRSEAAEQTALFMWVNMAMRFGKNIAEYPQSYTVQGFAKTQFDNADKLGYIKSSRPLHELKWLHAVHNQGHGDAIRGAKARAEGVKAGVADIFLPLPQIEQVGTAMLFPGDGNRVVRCCGLYIELKKKDGGKASPEQLEFISDMQAMGYKAVLCHGWLAACDEILNYLSIAG